jgi:hypothetical protein
MKCDNCESERIIEVSGKTSDCCYINYNNLELSGYVPGNIGLGRDCDYINLVYCLDCGKIQGKFPIKEENVIKELKSEGAIKND